MLAHVPPVAHWAINSATVKVAVKKRLIKVCKAKIQTQIITHTKVRFFKHGIN